MLYSFEHRRPMTVPEANAAYGPLVQNRVDGSPYDHRQTGVELQYRCIGCGKTYQAYALARACWLLDRREGA